MMKGNALDVLASVVSNIQDNLPVCEKSLLVRVSCHRCGNIRKRKILCPRETCPHIYCGRCADKMKEEFGDDVFNTGCPVCRELCCCNVKTTLCHRQNHCYRKCPATKRKCPSEDSHANSSLLPSKDKDESIQAPALVILAQVMTDSHMCSSKPQSRAKRKMAEVVDPQIRPKMEKYSDITQLNPEHIDSIRSLTVQNDRTNEESLLDTSHALLLLLSPRQQELSLSSSGVVCFTKDDSSSKSDMILPPVASAGMGMPKLSSSNLLSHNTFQSHMTADDTIGISMLDGNITTVPSSLSLSSIPPLTIKPINNPPIQSIPPSMHMKPSSESVVISSLMQLYSSSPTSSQMDNSMCNNTNNHNSIPSLLSRKLTNENSVVWPQ